MLAKLPPWPPFSWIAADGHASLWIGIPVAGMRVLNRSFTAAGLPRPALIFSLALHLVVLAGLPDPARRDRSPDPGSVQATLRLALPQPLPLTSAGIPKARRLPPRPIALTAKAGTGAAAPPAFAPPANTEPAQQANGGFPSTARQEAASTVPAAPHIARPPEDSQALDDYSRSLLKLLAGHWQYPRLAALRGWEGEVRLRLKVGGKGGLLAVQVILSSGYEVLDQHALQLVQGTSLPAPPASFGDSEIQVIVPIHYRLQKPT